MRVPAAVLVVTLSAASCRTEPPVAVDGARAFARVEEQVRMGPRIPGAPGHAAIQAWLRRELERLGAKVEAQSFTDTTLGRPVELVNLIAVWDAASPAQDPPRRVVLAAHYDTRAMADRDPEPARRSDPVPGANDGGSGVAVLLEVAEQLSRRRAPVEVELVFFDGEDQGRPTVAEEFLLGSRHYAARLAERSHRPAAAFVFDMVGDRDLGIGVEAFSRQRASNLVDMVLEGARATGGTHFAPETRYQVIDDHLPLLEAGLPAVDVIDFEYGAWHTTADQPDQVSAESLAEVARVASWLVYRGPLARSR